MISNYILWMHVSFIPQLITIKMCPALLLFKNVNSVCDV